MKDHLRKICLSGAFIAIGYIVTAFLSVPYGFGGYFNFGDVITLISAVILGPWYGALIGSAFSSMADLTSGFAMFIPFTIIAKSLMAVSGGYLYRLFAKKIRIFAFLIASLFMVVIYFFSYLIYFGLAAYLNSIFDLLQASIVSLFAYIILISLQKLIKNKENESVNNLD
jgi:uncharacterized membrane protein